MSCNRCKNPPKFVLRLHLIDLEKSLINVRRGRDQRRLCFDCAPVPNPIKRIPPAVLIESPATALSQHRQEVHRFLQIDRIRGRLIEECESHSVMGISDWEPHAVMKQAARRWQERFTKDHRSNGSGPDKAVSVIERLGAPADWASIKALKIPGGFTVSLQPFGEVRQDF